MPSSLWISSTLLYVALIAMATAFPAGHTNQRRQADLPCDHPLRIVVPSLFTHCATSCDYSEWTAWEIVQRRIPTTTNYCASRLYYVQQRTRQIVSVVGDRADCNEVNQTEQICYPTNEERLIVGLGLGGSGQDIDISTPIDIPLVISPIGIVAPPPGPQGPLALNISTIQIATRKRRDTRSRFARMAVNISATRCPHQNTAGEVCPHLSASRACKRSTGEHQDINNEGRIGRDDGINMRALSDSSHAPTSFNWKIHGSHFRQRRQTRCGDGDTQHVLFVLDSSGSISPSDFTEMKAAISKLVPIFCKKIKTALINFSSDIRLEYCFDCFLNTLHGRSAASAAINTTQYLGQCTNTAATAKCICENILDRSCGISSTPECLDVVIITDGESNDPNLRICDEIRCLHNQAGISTYAIGVGGYDPNELECINNSSDDFGMFEYETFQEFKESIDKVLALVTNATVGGNWQSCAARDRTFSPTGGLFG